ncbi:MAG: dihydroneopterin aldolase [Candidatus Fermentibacteraceae bacterium]|nr:dihydroneopterin aldolase [Candidatus Fermentibacteraceae bacterium]
MVEENRRLTGNLSLEGISLALRLGALPFERIEPRRVLVDLEWTGEVFRSGKPVVDYSLVCSALKNGVETEYLFIEELAGDILELLEERWPGAWTVTVGKMFPPVDPPMERASVSITGGYAT